MLKSSKPQIKTVSVWSKDSVETLKGSLLCTNWDVFYNSDIDVAVDTITDYLKFCVDCVVPKKEVKVYPNNKPYISKDVKDCINRKKTAFKNRDSLGLKIVQKELNQKLRDARKKHKDIIEQNFISMDPKKLWDSMKAAANMTTTRRCLVTDDEFIKANELNDFFMRFKTQDFSSECDKVLQSINLSDSCPGLTVDPSKIQSLFRGVCKKKSTGPDGISAFLLKTCAEELTPVWCPIF